MRRDIGECTCISCTNECQGEREWWIMKYVDLDFPFYFFYFSDTQFTKKVLIPGRVPVFAAIVWSTGFIN